VGEELRPSLPSVDDQIKKIMDEQAANLVMVRKMAESMPEKDRAAFLANLEAREAQANSPELINFAMVVSNESGEGGASLARRNFGETKTRLTTAFPPWFAADYRRFNDRPGDLPVDQHMLLALMAPRAVVVPSADEDLWADPRGEFLALAHSSPVFALWGEPAIGADSMPPLDTPLVAGRRA
jgi:hypothetical protein